MRQAFLALAATTAALALAGCAGFPGFGGPSAVATLAPTTGNITAGTVKFTQQTGKVLVSGEVRGLKPNA